jgi:hypothetical protein
MFAGRRGEPLQARRFAATVAELAIGAPGGERVELGGPQALGIDAWTQRLFATTGVTGQSLLTGTLGTTARSCTAAS